ncbi:unnamed protein product [Adineta steineri]|uniref:Uncharacterized protein n=2 Tax=Adineta steineri TaxID=433720 RepID=A0A819ET60_9BILA|nr:unnamed protein product [Adineta steineri]
MQRQQISQVLSSDESSSRVLIHSAKKTSEHTLPLSITPSPMANTRRTICTQTVQEIQPSSSTKPIPSFAETQLLSVYYPSLDPKNPSTDDKCIFVEQQERQPVRYRATYDPLFSSQSTQTLPLSTYGSTLIIDKNQITKSNYEKHLNINDERSLPNESIEKSKYIYEEYTVQLNEKQNRTSSSSSSSVTTVIAQNEDLDSDYTSNLSSDAMNTQSSITSIPINHENKRISSWPPVPDDISPLNNQYEQKPSLHVQFSEQLINIIPPSARNSLNDESLSPPAVIPRTKIYENNQLQRLDTRPVNQSKWVKTQLDNSENSTNIVSNRVNTLRSIFEQDNSRSSDSSTLNSPINQTSRKEPEEKPSEYGDKIRFRIKDINSSTIHHAQPAKIIQHTINSKQDEHSTLSFKLDQIQKITNKQIQSLDDIGHYLQDGHTWQWNEIFWLSLTNSQRDQLKDLEHQLDSRPKNTNYSDLSSSSSSNETKQFKSTINITAAGAWQPKSQILPSSITKYTEANTINENQSSISSFGSAPLNPTYTRIGSQESISSSINQQQNLTSNKRTDSQITIIESGYSSSDDQQRYRPNSSTIIEESSTPKINSSKQSKHTSLNYEQFIYEYLLAYGTYTHSNNGSLILNINQQQIDLPSLAENISIDKNLSPFETESNELVLFIDGRMIIIPSNHWLVYREKYSHAQWIKNLKKVNRNIPEQFIPIIEEWLSNHVTISLDTDEINIDGLIIPLIEKLETYSSNEMYKYLLHIGYISYNIDEKLVYIGHNKLDIHPVLTSSSASSPQLIEQLTKLLRLLDHIHFHNENGSLLITDNFIIPNEYISNLYQKYQQEQILNANELAKQLLQICQVEEDKNSQSLILTFQNQILHLKNFNEYHIKILTQWLQQLNQQKLICITEQNDIIIYLNNINQQIFIHYEDVEIHMKTKQDSNIIRMHDIAHILLQFNYIKYSAGQFIFDNQQIVLDINQLNWLQSIIRSIRINEHKEQTDVELLDGQHIQLLEIPYEYMLPTTESEAVVNYLFQNGNIHYEVNRGDYTYHYISPNEKIHSKDQELLSSHIRHIHIDKDNRRIEIEFLYDSKNYLEIPVNWYEQISQHDFTRSYIISMLFKNGGILNTDKFIFNNYTYLLKEKDNIINNYVEYINNHDGIKYDKVKNCLILQNLVNNSQLYLTPVHTEFIQKNQYRREDMKYILTKYSQLKQDEYNNWLLYYNNQCIQISFENNQQMLKEETSNELLYRYHSIINYMYNHGLIICNKTLKLIQIHFLNEILTIPIDQLHSIINRKIFHSPNNDILPFTSQQLSQWLLDHSNRLNSSHQDNIQLIYKNKFYDLPLIHHSEKSDLQLLFPFNKSLRLIQKTPSTTTLDIQQPNETNNYTTDPLLIFANYIHRTGSIYQDQFGRLIIKLNKDEIVIPQSDATNAIEAINATPNRTGTTIARLINRLGRIQSNKFGGLTITIGKKSFELSKETIEEQNSIQKPISTKRQTNLPVLKVSKSADDLSSLNTKHTEFIDDQQILHTRYRTNPRSSYLQPYIIIIPDNETIRSTRFYIQYKQNSNSVQSTQPKLINPQYHQDIALRQARVYIHKHGEEEISYENLAEYLSKKKFNYLSSRTIRRMLKFSSSDDYFTYLSKKMSTIKAKQFVQESEEYSNESSFRSINSMTKLSHTPVNLNDDRLNSSGVYYNVRNGTTMYESNLYDEQQQQDDSYNYPSKSMDRSLSSSSLNSEMLIRNTFSSRQTVQ